MGRGRGRQSSLERFVAGWVVVVSVVSIGWNLSMNNDPWRTAVVHGTTFALSTFGVAVLWFRRRTLGRIGATGKEGPAQS